jgi:hypothetical protein
MDQVSFLLLTMEGRYPISYTPRFHFLPFPDFNMSKQACRRAGDVVCVCVEERRGRLLSPTTLEVLSLFSSLCFASVMCRFNFFSFSSQWD